MDTRRKLRLAGALMLFIAVIFVLYALSSPTLGTTVYIGGFAFGAAQWRLCYAIYIIAMIALFIASFFAKKE